MHRLKSLPCGSIRLFLTTNNLIPQTAEETTSPARKKSEAEVLSPKLSRAATTIAEEAVDQLQASEKLIAGTVNFELNYFK